MTNSKISALTANTTPALTDILPIVDDPGGTPSTQKATLAVVDTLFRSNNLAAVSVAAATLASSDVEATILPAAAAGSYTLAAGYFSSIGKALHVRLMGVISNTSTPTLTVKMKLGTTIQAATAAVTTPSGLSDNIFVADFWLTCITTGASGTIRTQGTIQLGAAVAGAPSTAAVTNDTTGALVINVTGQWGTSSASNTLSVTNVFVEKLN